MKRLYLTVLFMMVFAGFVMGQPSMTLAKIISDGTQSEFYTIKDDLLGVYTPPHRPNVIFAKDENGYGNKSQPTEEQFDAGLLYDERNGYYDDWEEWVGSFDQSNWVKIALPEGEDASQYVGCIIKGNTVTGRINVQEYPCRPLGLTITLEPNPSTPEVPVTLPERGEFKDYNPNLYCCGNFVKQDSWYFVKPQNQEKCDIRWAVWHAADTMFYAPENDLGLPGSFKIDMSLWEPQPYIDPMLVFKDAYQYDFPAIVEFRLGFTFNINIDPGFSGENNIHFAPKRMDVVDNPGERPEYIDPDGVVYPYTVIVYPLRLDYDGIFTGIDGVETSDKVAVATRYVDLLGRESKQPHEGLNIVQTIYDDGTVETRKAMKPTN